MFSNTHYWESPYIDWESLLPQSWVLLVFRVRQSRNKAIVAAVTEALALLEPYHPVALLSGPLAGERGVFWVGVHRSYLTRIPKQLANLGYTTSVACAVPIAESIDAPGFQAVEFRTTRWHGEEYKLIPLYKEDRNDMRSHAPDQRAFLLPDWRGQVQAVRGYRGDGTELGRRALPVEDARILVNLVLPTKRPIAEAPFLDVFAGAGGVVWEAIKFGFRVFSVDIDPIVKYGLQAFGSLHTIADGCRLPFRDRSISAVATEPPYSENTRSMLVETFYELFRILQFKGRLAMLLVPWQAESLLTVSKDLELDLVLATPINRKGTEVAIVVWEKRQLGE